MVDVRNQAPGTLIAVVGASANDQAAASSAAQRGETDRGAPRRTPSTELAAVPDRRRAAHRGPAGRRAATGSAPSTSATDDRWSPACRPTTSTTRSRRWSGWRLLLGLLGRASPRAAWARSSYAASCGRCARSPTPRTGSPSCRCPRARSTCPTGCPTHLTDERTEVGQVGAALNTLLEHVESVASARGTAASSRSASSWRTRRTSCAPRWPRSPATPSWPAADPTTPRPPRRPWPRWTRSPAG